MNVFEILKQDHQRVSGIFMQMESYTGGDAGAMQSLFTQLKSELSMHTHVEETIFYPAIKRAAETHELILDAIEDHQEVKNLLTDMEAMTFDDKSWNAMLMELRRNVEQHVEEEESEMFEKAQQVLSEQEIQELGQRIMEAKQQQSSTPMRAMGQMS